MAEPTRLEIARATSDIDLAFVLALQRMTLPYDKPWPVTSGYWWLAKESGGVVGFGGMTHSVRWADAVYLCRSGVQPSFRGRGIQKRLIRARLAHARKIGMAWAITDTKENPASANALIACGFRMYEPQHPWGGRKTLYWRCKL